MQIIIENLKPTRNGHYRLLPNINRSGRTLPSDVSKQDLSANDKLDKELPSRKLSDKEIYSFLVDISDQELAAHTQVILEVSLSPDLFKLLNHSGIPLISHDKPPVLIDLKQAKKDSTKSRGMQFFLEAQTFWGSPLVDKNASPTVAFRILDDQGAVLLSQNSWTGNDLRTADLILVGDDAPPERIFMCEVDDNQPSVRELSEGTKIAGVPLTLVPMSVGMGDSWLQDQFQLGYTGTPEGQQQVIVHLPRMVNDSALFAGTPNLRNFTDTYFPSQAIGVVKDFWRLTIDIQDGVVPSLQLDVAQTFVLYKQLMLVIRLLKAMFSLMLEIDPSSRPKVPGDDFTDLYLVRLAIDSYRAKLMSYRNLKPDTLNKVMNIKPVVDALSNVLDVQGDKVGLSIAANGKTQKFVYDANNRTLLKDMFVALYDIHSSRNYGGNVEVSPPYKGVPYGKILAGSISSAQLRDLLTSRGSLHPLATVYTEWLEVGDIDEIAAFAAKGQDSFCVLRASPKLTLDMLDRLVAYQAKNVLVTRLLRGKKWIHESSTGATDARPPPGAYRRLLKSGIYDLSGLDTKIPKDTKPSYGDAIYHDDRQFLVLSKLSNVNARYAAMVSCADLLAMCRTANRTVEDLFLSDSFAYSDDLTYRPYLRTRIFVKTYCHIGR